MVSSNVSLPSPIHTLSLSLPMIARAAGLTFGFEALILLPCDASLLGHGLSNRSCPDRRLLPRALVLTARLNRTRRRLRRLLGHHPSQMQRVVREQPKLTLPSYLATRRRMRTRMLPDRPSSNDSCTPTQSKRTLTNLEIMDQVLIIMHCFVTQHHGRPHRPA